MATRELPRTTTGQNRHKDNRNNENKVKRKNNLPQSNIRTGEEWRWFKASSESFTRDRRSLFSSASQVFPEIVKRVRPTKTDEKLKERLTDTDAIMMMMVAVTVLVLLPLPLPLPPPPPPPLLLLPVRVRMLVLVMATVMAIMTTATALGHWVSDPRGVAEF